MSSWSNWFGALTSSAAATMDNLVNSLDIHNNTSTSTDTTNTDIPNEENEESRIKSLLNKFQQSGEGEDVIVKTVDRTFDFAAGAFRTGLQRLTQLTSPTSTTVVDNEEAGQARPKEQHIKLDFDSRDWDTVFRRYGGHSTLEALQVISGEASIELKRALKKMTPKDIATLQPHFDSIDSSLESEKLLENAIPLDHNSGLIDSSNECQNALSSIHEDVDMEVVAKHAANASITQFECLLILRRNQSPNLLPLSSETCAPSLRILRTLQLVSLLLFLYYNIVLSLFHISRNCY